jgi:muramoyltetrapeptide carboxypeptidase
MFCPGTVLLIEDIAEPIYKVERQLWQLRLKGVLKNLKGLLVGAFTDYRPTADYQSMEEMISAMTADCDYPVVFGVPCGHGGRSLPMIEGARIKINVHADEGADVEFLY